MIRTQLFAVWLAALGAAPALAADADTPVRLVGLTVPSLTNPYFTALTRAAEVRARERVPGVRVLATASEFDVPGQVREMDRLTQEHADVILIAAAHPVELAAAVARARKAGAAVVAVDVDVEGVDVAIQSNNFGAGETVCRDLAQRLGGTGRFLIQNGPQVSSVVERVKGCRAALKDFPGITLLTDQGDGMASPWGGRDLMTRQIAMYTTIDAVFAINDRQALGVEMAAQQAGLKKLLIGSVDGSPDIESALKRPGFIVVSAAQRPAEMGRRGVDVALAMRAGRATERGRILLDTTLVTRENVARYRGWTTP